MSTPSLLTLLIEAVRFDDMSARDIRRSLSITLIQALTLLDEAIVSGYVVSSGTIDNVEHYCLSNGMYAEYLCIRPNYDLAPLSHPSNIPPFSNTTLSLR